MNDVTVPKKLYEMEKNTKFRVMGENDTFDEPLMFIHTDGMYSVCIYKGEVIHLSVMTPIEEIL
jgi:hypothetical protein